MAITTIDIRKEQQDVRAAQYELAISRGYSEEEAQNIAAAASNLVGAQLLSQINLSTPAAPIDPFDPAYSPQNNSDPNKVSGVAVVTSNSSGSIINFINQNLVHECAQNQYVKKAVELASGLARGIILAIRKTITAALKALGFNPALGGFAAVIKTIQEFIDNITYYINQINDFIKNVVEVIAKIRALIDYILSLPAELLRLFRECLTQAYAELQRTIFQAIGELGDIGTDGANLDSITGLLQSSRELTQATYNLLQTPSKLINSVNSPSTLTQAEKNSLLSQLFPGYTEYDKNSYGRP